MRKNKKKQKQNQPKEFLPAIRGLEVKIYLRNGEEIKGEILSISTYEIIVKTKEGKDLLIFKHAIDFIDYFQKT
ncbi:RNA chaperone Hfq [Methanocaldococcus sp.]